MRRQFSVRALLPGLAILIAVVGARAASSQGDQTTTRATMRGIFVTISEVYGYSLDATAFADPKNKQEILTKLHALAENAASLENHGGGLDPSYEFMRRSLATDARVAYTEFNSGNDVGARFVLSQVTENCVTCHSTLPAGGEFAPGKEFMNSLNTTGLPDVARAKLQVASRQFNDALATWEGVLASRETSETDLQAYDVFENYLRVSLGPVNDPHRPEATLERFLARPDMSDALKANVRAWTASLKTLTLDVAPGTELENARRLTAPGGKVTVAQDRAHLVDYIASITLLHRYLRAGKHGDNEVAESYYLLGVAESHVSHSYWVTDTEYLLAQSVQTAPKSRVAKQALAYLEDYRKSARTVAPARPVPAELQVDIDALRKLTEK